MKRKDYTPKDILADLPEPIVEDIRSFLVRNPEWVPEEDEVRSLYFVLIRTWFACHDEQHSLQLFNTYSLGSFLRTVILYMDLSPISSKRRVRLQRTLIFWMFLVALMVFCATMVIAWGIGTIIAWCVHSLLRSRDLFWLALLLLVATGLGVRVALTWLEKLLIRSIWVRVSLVLPPLNSAQPVASAFGEYLHSAKPQIPPLARYF